MNIYQFHNFGDHDGLPINFNSSLAHVNLDELIISPISFFFLATKFSYVLHSIYALSNRAQSDRNDQKM